MFDPELPCRAYVRHVYADRDDPQCRGRYFLVVFHPDPDDMRRAAYRHDKSSAYRTHRPGSVDDALGLWQPASARARYDRKQRMWVDTTPPFAGVMRFARGHLTPDVIAHESTHTPRCTSPGYTTGPRTGMTDALTSATTATLPRRRSPTCSATSSSR